MKGIDIIECTLRDGSYNIDYRFSAKDTALIATALQETGVKFIEIGHGLGLNASNLKGKAAEKDEVYLRTAMEVLTKSEYGMFFIPGIGRKEDLDMASGYEMDFVRIGTDITRADEAGEYIEHAKELGMKVSSNLMKSYALPPHEFARKAKMVDEFGADTIVLVDSAGGMLPEDISSYIGAMRDEKIGAQIGFHGHNNLSLAIANTLKAIECGATVVDSTLGGIGRSAGNAATEILVTILKKMGYDLGIDEFKAMDMAENLISPLMAGRGGIDPIAITSGYAGFHSGFFESISKFSKKYSVDPRKLIIEVCRRTKTDLPDELAESLAKELSEERAALSDVSKIDIPSTFEIPRERWDHRLSNTERARVISQHLENISKKTGKQTIFTLNVSAKSDDINVVYPSIQESSSYLMASCEMTGMSEMIEVCKVMDGVVDFILLDDEKKKTELFDAYNELANILKDTTLLTYKDNNSWIQGVDNFISTHRQTLYGAKVGILGLSDVSTRLALFLADRGARVSVFESGQPREKIDAMNLVKVSNSPFAIECATDLEGLSTGADVLIGHDKRMLIDRSMVEMMSRDGIIIDSIFGSIEPTALELARKYKIPVWRTDMRAAMAGEVTTVLRTYNLLSSMGQSSVDGITVVSGGYVGAKGDVVVDSISNPSQVIGIADGRGGIMYGDQGEFSERIRKVELALFQRMVKGRNIPPRDEL